MELNGIHFEQLILNFGNETIIGTVHRVDICFKSRKNYNLSPAIQKHFKVTRQTSIQALIIDLNISLYI